MDSSKSNLQETIKSIHRDINRYAPKEEKTNIVAVAIKNLYCHPSLAGVIYYRIGRWLWTSRQNLLFAPLFVCYRILYPLVRIYSGLELSPRAQIGSGLCVMHFGPTVIHPAVIAGENLTLLRGVTIGATKNGIPRLGNNVAIGTGATIIGGIVIGDNVTIGAGAVVTNDLPDGCVAIGIPARPIKSDSSITELE